MLNFCEAYILRGRNIPWVKCRRFFCYRMILENIGFRSRMIIRKEDQLGSTIAFIKDVSYWNFHSRQKGFRP